MEKALTKDTLEKILDGAIRDVTEQTAGVQLVKEQQNPLGDNICTVHITFDKGFDKGLILYADTSLLMRMAQNTFHDENISREDLEEFGKEYFNVLCGKVAGALFRETQTAAHFSPPTFYSGRFFPESREAVFALTYSDGNSDGAAIVHYRKGSAEE